MASLVTRPELSSVPKIQAQTAKLDKRLLVFAAVVFGLACLMFFGQLGSAPLFNPDETLYAEPAREMLESGNYIVEYLNYAVRHTKPPLAIWMMVGCYQMFGVNEFAARFGGAACGAILATVTALFARKYSGERLGWIAAAILISSPLFLAVGREAITDMPLTLFTVCSIMAFFHGYQQKLQRWVWVGYIMLAAAVMTKGPVGFLIPAGILVIYHFLRAELKPAAKFYKLVPGLLLTASLALPWFVLVTAKTDGGYFREFIVRENFQRFTSVVDHKAPWWYHIAAIFGGLFPWSLFLPFSLVGAVKSIGPKPNSDLQAGTAAEPVRSLRETIFANLKKLDQRQSMIMLSVISTVLVVTFYSLSVSKLMAYTLPAVPFIAILLASFFEDLRERNNAKPFVWGFGLLTLAYGLASYVVPLVSGKLRDCPPELPALIPTVLCTLALSCSLVWGAALRKQLNAVIPFFALLLMCCTMFFGSQALNALAEYWEIPIRAYSQFAGSSNWPIVVYQFRKPSVMFYAKREIKIIEEKKELEDTLFSQQHAYIITRTNKCPELAALGCKILSNNGYAALAMWERSKRPLTP